MPSLRTIKSKIRSVTKTHQVTKAMEAVSAAKMRKAQVAALVARPYAETAFKILARISNSIDLSQHPLMQKKGGEGKNTRVLLVVISSDRGLAGGLNSSLFKHAQRELKKRGILEENTGIVAIGRKGEDYFTHRGYIIEEKIVSFGDKSITSNFSDVVRLVTDLFMRDVYDECAVVYTNFLSTFEQKPAMRALLPLSIDAFREMIEGIPPVRGKFAEGDMHAKLDKNIAHASDYLFEPSAEAVFDTLIPRLLAIELHHAFLESKASEHSARMVAMRNASDKAEEVEFSLTREYNKARQSAITREMSEIIGGIEAMK
ncbi:MAG: ATP synthase F1 subunit gamma [Patescibacteria group bacterium]